MTTEFEFSASLVFWGDALESQRLAHDLQLVVDRRRAKGELLRAPDGTHLGIAKTGMLSCELGPPGSSLRRTPESQLLTASGALKRLTAGLSETYGVDEAQLQLFIYYKDKMSGEPDFMFPPELIEVMAQHRILLRITALP